MTIYLFLDEDGFCTGWSSNEDENLTPYETDDENILNGIMKYRYLNGVLVYDETKALISAKTSKKNRAKKIFLELLAKGFQITIANVQYTYPYDEDSKAYLNKVYELSTSGLIDEATFDFRQGDELVTISVDKVNITELWLLSFLHEEDLKKKINAFNVRVDETKSLAELQEIVFDNDTVDF